MPVRVGASCVVVLLAGCASRDARVATLAGEGFYERAHVVADHDPARERAVRRALLADLGLTVATEPVPVEAFGVRPEGYGETWLLVGVGLERAPEVADRVVVEVTLDGWARCAECDAAWMIAQMAPPPEGAPPEVRVSEAPGLFGLIEGAGVLLELGRVIGGVILTPTAMLLDTMVLTSVARSGGEMPYRPYGLTKLVFDATLGYGLRASAAASAVAEVADDGLSCVGDFPCSTLVVYRGTGAAPTSARVVVTATRGPVEATGTQQLAVSGTVAEAFAAAFPSEGRRLVLEAP